MADFAVTTVFKSKDGITGNFKRMGAAANKFGRQSAGAFDTANRKALTFKTTVGAILSAGVIRRTFGLLTQGVREAVTEFISFDDAITAAAAKFDGIERGTKVFNELKAVARDVGATTEFTAAQAAEGLRFLAKAGFEPAFAMKSLKSFVDLATASEMEFAEATDIATDVMGAFRLNAENTEVRMKNLIRVNDVMAKAVNMANIDMTDLFETIKLAGPVAVDAGVSLEKFTAIAAFIGGAGIKASQGGTALRTSMLALTAKTPAATKVFRKLGIELVDAKKNLRDPILIFEDLRKKMEGMGNAQKSATLAVIFGKRAIAGASVSIAGGSKALGKFEKALMDSGGTSKRMADLMRQSLGKRLAALKSGAIELAFKFFDAFEKKMPGALDRATEAVRKFDMGPVIEGVKTLAKWISATLKVVKFLAPAIVTLVLAKTAYLVVTKAIFAFKAAQWFLALAKATHAATAAQGLLNVAMAANPAGLIITGLALVVAAGWTYANNINAINDHAAKSWVAGEKSFEGVKNDYILGLRLIAEHADKSKSSVVMAFGGLMADVRLGHTLMAEHAKKSWDTVGVAMKAAWKDAIDSVMLGFADIKKFFTDLPDIAARAWAGVLKAFKGAAADIMIGFSDIAKAFSFTRPPTRTPRERGLGPPPGAESPGAAGREAPNAAEVAAQRINFRGKMTFENPPPGSVFESETTGAPPISIEGLGYNL